MGDLKQRTIDLASEQARFIDAKVAAGEYDSASEVVQAGIRALQEQDAAFERWLREEVVPTYDAWRADPSLVVSLDEAFSTLRSRYEARTAKE